MSELYLSYCYSRTMLFYIGALTYERTLGDASMISKEPSSAAVGATMKRPSVSQDEMQCYGRVVNWGITDHYAIKSQRVFYADVLNK